MTGTNRQSQSYKVGDVINGHVLLKIGRKDKHGNQYFLTKCGSCSNKKEAIPGRIFKDKTTGCSNNSRFYAQKGVFTNEKYTR